MNALKVCSSCGRSLPISEFYKRPTGARDGLTSGCWHCQYQSSRRSLAKAKARGYKPCSTPRTRYALYRNNARARGIPFELTFEQFMSFWQQPCAYCGDAIDPVGIDRVDSSLGYVNGNIAPCCVTCNAWKNCLTVEQFATHLKKVYSRLVEGLQTPPPTASSSEIWVAQQALTASKWGRSLGRNRRIPSDDQGSTT